MSNFLDCRSLLVHHKTSRGKLKKDRLPIPRSNSKPLGPRVWIYAIKVVAIRMHIIINRDPGWRRTVWVGIDGTEDLFVAEDTRPGDNGAHAITNDDRDAEVLAVTGDLTKVLPAAPQTQILLSDCADPADFFVDGVRFVEAVPTHGAERTKGTAEKGFSNVAITSAGAIETLLGAIIDAWNAQSGHIQGQSGKNKLVSLVTGAEPSFIHTTSPDLIVVVDHCYDLVACPSVRTFFQVQRVSE